MPKYQVEVEALGEKMVATVKVLRTVAALSLRDAVRLSDYIRESAPCLLVAGVDREVADHVAGRLRDVGARVRVEESSVTVPMLLCPHANRRYRWSWLGGPTPA